jgi:glycosyltransferase involved in cell wall biosynthesis
MRICFYANMSAHENWREMFDKVEFYRVDIRLLRELGHEVVLAGRPKDLDLQADVYYCWWWGHAPYALALGALLRKPVIVTGAFDYATCRDEIPGMCYLDRPLWQQFVLRGTLRVADANLFISKYEHDEVTSNLYVKNPVLAPLAVDTDFYCPLQHKPFKSDYFFTVSWTSRTNVIRKGLIQSIEAFSRIASDFPYVRLVIAGKHGDYEQSLRELAERLNVAQRVEFLGLISDKEKLEHYRRCIAYVQPTLYEGFGLAIAEAVASGCPVISSPRGAVPEVVDQFGMCVDPNDIDAIVAVMKAFMQKDRCYLNELKSHAWIHKMYSLRVRRDCLESVLTRLAR